MTYRIDGDLEDLMNRSIR